MNRLSTLSLLVLAIFLGGSSFTAGDVSFSLSGSTSSSYSKFIKDLRNALPSKAKVYNITLLLSSATGASRYTLMKLSNYDGKTITVAIDVTNVYIMGYLVNTTSYFFNEPDAKLASQHVFKGRLLHFHTLAITRGFKLLQAKTESEFLLDFELWTVQLQACFIMIPQLLLQHFL